MSPMTPNGLEINQANSYGGPPKYSHDKYGNSMSSAQAQYEKQRQLLSQQLESSKPGAPANSSGIGKPELHQQKQINEQLSENLNLIGNLLKGRTIYNNDYKS